MEQDHGEENTQKTFRLHVGGIGPTVLPQDLERRFSSFGTVLKVDGVGKLDANGSPLHYAFVDILSTDLQVKRCMNLLSGTTYKGNTLRIAPARPDYIARAEREKANLPINTSADPDEAALREREEKAALKLERKLAKIRASKRGIEGYQSSNMELMTVKRFKSRQGVNGWKKEPESSLPIFPLITRPLRPLPLLDIPSTQESDPKEANPVTRVPTRARRIRIDPTLYRAAIKHRKTHILGPRAISIEQYKLGFTGGAKNMKNKKSTRPMWDCHLSEDGHVVWTLQNGVDGSHEERVQLSSYTLKKLREVAESCTYQSYHPDSPQEPNHVDQLCSSSKATSTSVNLKTSNSSDISMNPASPKSDPTSPPDVSEPLLEEASRTETQHESSKMESTSAHCAGACSGVSSTSPLRLRGGSSVKKTKYRSTSPEVQLSNLTDMFKAKEKEKKGFRLDDVLQGMELDEDMLAIPDDDSEPEVSSGSKVEKIHEEKKSKAFIHPSRLNGSGLAATVSSTRTQSGGPRKGPFFFYPTDEDPDSQVINALLSSERRESARQHWLSQDLPPSSNGWRSFFSADSISQIESEHNQNKSQLTEHMRRKHKDALKQERKRASKPLEL